MEKGEWGGGRGRKMREEPGNKSPKKKSGYKMNVHLAFFAV